MANEDKYEKQKELIMLKYKLQVKLIQLMAKEARQRHIERMEFLIYRDSGIMTDRTKKEIESNDSLREQVLGISTEKKTIEYQKSSEDSEKKLKLAEDYGDLGRVYGK